MPASWPLYATMRAILRTTLDAALRYATLHAALDLGECVSRRRQDRGREIHSHTIKPSWVKSLVVFYTAKCGGVLLRRSQQYLLALW